MILDPVNLKDSVLRNYSEKNFQPNSYDLRLNRVFEIRGGVKMFADGRKQLPRYTELPPMDEPWGYPNPAPPEPWFLLRPNTLYQLEFMETVHLSGEIAAISIMRSSMSKSGASGEAGLYDSGYEGTCGMTVNVTFGAEVQRGAAVAQMVFFRADTSQLYDGEYLDMKWAERLLST